MSNIFDGANFISIKRSSANGRIYYDDGPTEEKGGGEGAQ
jgi:hypothetical protein